MTPDNLEIGGGYNWHNQPERLIYMGSKLYPDDGLWYQFDKVDTPDICWIEVREEDLASLEATDAPATEFSKKTLKAPSPNHAQCSINLL